MSARVAIKTSKWRSLNFHLFSVGNCVLQCQNKPNECAHTQNTTKHIHFQMAMREFACLVELTVSLVYVQHFSLSNTKIPNANTSKPTNIIYTDTFLTVIGVMWDDVKETLDIISFGSRLFFALCVECKHQIWSEVIYILANVNSHVCRLQLYNANFSTHIFDINQICGNFEQFKEVTNISLSINWSVNSTEFELFDVYVSWYCWIS